MFCFEAGFRPFKRFERFFPQRKLSNFVCLSFADCVGDVGGREASPSRSTDGRLRMATLSDGSAVAAGRRGNRRRTTGECCEKNKRGRHKTTERKKEIVKEKDKKRETLPKLPFNEGDEDVEVGIGAAENG